MARKSARPRTTGRRAAAGVAAPTTVWTIGHSRHPWETFLGLVRAHGIALVADVRSMPRSRFVPHANRSRLETALPATGVGYVWLGEGLGGKPEDEAFYDAEGRVRYDQVAASTRFREQFDELLAFARVQRVAVMCAEEDPRNCHRRSLLTPALLTHGVTVMHIRGNGSVVAEDKLAREAEQRARRGQGTLFPES